MKPYLPLLLLGLTACSDWNDDGTETVPTEQTAQPAQEAIRFAASVVPSQTAIDTRADGSIVNRLETSLFETKDRIYFSTNKEQKTAHYAVGLFGYYTGQAAWTAEATPNFMYNTPFNIGPAVGGANDLEYADTDAPIRFWPNNYLTGSTTANERVSFWAYYPYNPTVSPGAVGAHGISVVSDASGVGAGKGMGSLKFTMNTDASEQSDFMISELVPNCRKDQYALKSDASGGYIPQRVPLKFHHMLAQVRLYAFVRGTDKVFYAKRADGKEWRIDHFDDDAHTVTLYYIDDTSAKQTQTITIDTEKYTRYYVDAWGMTQEFTAGMAVPDDMEWLEPARKAGFDAAPSQTLRWYRSDVKDVTGVRYRAAATNTMSFNNIYTTATFTPTYDTETGKTTFPYSDQGALNSVTVSNYITNPYWFRFNSKGERVMLNETYMYDYFEQTPANRTTNMSAEEQAAARVQDGIDWATYMNGKPNAMGFRLDDETIDRDDTRHHMGDHFNYPPGNIILAVPQQLRDDNVPSISVTSAGNLNTYTWDGTKYVQNKGEAITGRVTVNLLQMGIKWESGFIYCYAFLEDNLQPGDDKVKGPESITVVFDPTRQTDQW